MGVETFKVFLVHWINFHSTPGQASCDKPQEAPDADCSVVLHRWRATRADVPERERERERQRERSFFVGGMVDSA